MNIHLNIEPNPQGLFIFNPGHVLQGTVELTLDSTKSFRAFFINVFGQAKAQWTTGSGNSRNHHEGIEVFLNSRNYIFGQSGGPVMSIEPGHHKYKFACQLPDQLPYSLDVPHGKIEYHVEADLDIPWNFDKKNKVPIFIVRNDDLNLYQDLKMSQNFEEIKTFCCCACKSQPVIMQVRLSHTGYVSGQVIPLKLEMTNKSDVDVMSTKVHLDRIIVLTSSEQATKKDIKKVAEKTFGGVRAGDNVEFECFLEIPQNMMTSNGLFCNVIKVQYMVEIEGQVDGCRGNPSIKFPIVIGTIPLHFHDQTIIQPTAPMKRTTDNDLPPSFDEAVNMSKPASTIINMPTNIGWNNAVPSAPTLKS